MRGALISRRFRHSLLLTRIGGPPLGDVVHRQNVNGSQGRLKHSAHCRLPCDGLDALSVHVQFPFLSRPNRLRSVSKLSRANGLKKVLASLYQSSGVNSIVFWLGGSPIFSSLARRRGGLRGFGSVFGKECCLPMLIFAIMRSTKHQQERQRHV